MQDQGMGTPGAQPVKPQQPQEPMAVPAEQPTEPMNVPAQEPATEAPASNEPVSNGQ